MRILLVNDDGVFAEGIYHLAKAVRELGNLIVSSFAFSKSSLKIWKFLVHVLLKHSLENFEHYFTSM